MNEGEKDVKVGWQRKSSSKSIQYDPILFSPSRGHFFSSPSSRGSNSLSSHSPGASASHLLSLFVDVLKRSFLPIGYPHSVKKEYLEYQFFDSVQGLCSYLRGVLCTHAVLVATGVGSEEASAWSAAITWVMRDGVGMIFAIIFTTSFSTYFGSYIKEWRLFADFINDVALTLDILSPLFPRSIYLYVLFLSAICKTMCGISANSTKLCITNHLCLLSNESDVNAKEGSQETAICLIGLALGVLFSSIIGRDRDDSDSSSSIYSLNYLLFFSLTCLHFYSNYRAISCLRLETISRTRGYLLIQSALSLFQDTALWKDFDSKKENFLQNYLTITSNSLTSSSSLSLSLSSINQKESVWLTLQLSLGLISVNEIFIGVSLQDALVSLSSSPSSTSSLSLWQTIQSFSRELSYCIIPTGDRESKNRSRYDVILRSHSTQRDQLKAYCHCLFVQRITSHSSSSSLSLSMDYTDFIQSQNAFEQFWSGFLAILSHEGWNMTDSTISMDSREWLCEWGEEERLSLSTGSKKDN